MSMLRFEWDQAKATSNLTKHGVAFEDACTVFNDPFALDVEDRSVNYAELRRRIVGVGNGIYVTVIYTERDETVRIISARRATRSERRAYDHERW